MERPDLLDPVGEAGGDQDLVDAAAALAGNGAEVLKGHGVHGHWFLLSGEWSTLGPERTL